MSTIRRCKNCFGSDGQRVVLQGHRCPYRNSKNTVSAAAITAPTPAVDNAHSPVSPAPASPAALSSPFDPATIHSKTIDVNTYYTTHSLDSFEMRSPSIPANSPNVTDMLFNFGPTNPPFPSINNDTPYGTSILAADGSRVVIQSSGPSEALLDMAISGFNMDDFVSVNNELQEFLDNSPALDSEDVLMQLSNSASEIFSVPVMSAPAPAPEATPADSQMLDATSQTPVDSMGSTPSTPVPTSSISLTPVPTSSTPAPIPVPVSAPAMPCRVVGGVRRRCASEPAKKRRRIVFDNDDDSDDEQGLTYIQNANARRKAHSKRARSLLKRATALNTISQPHIMLYCARPESVCHRNGAAIAFMSNGLEAIVGPDFLRDFHERVMDTAHKEMFNPQIAIDLNLEVVRITREKEEEEARRVAAEAQQSQLEATITALQQQIGQMQLAAPAVAAA